MKEGLTLKNTREGCEWSISIHGLDVDELEEIDNQLKEKWGNNKMMKKKRPFAWKEFWIGVGITYVVLTIFGLLLGY